VLKSLKLLPVYDSSEYNLVSDLQVPLLQNSIDYLRGVGFFTSGWLRIASKGMTDFIYRGGKARIILSPILEEKDWEAFKLGEEARFDNSLRSLLTKRVNDLLVSLETDTLNALAWMIADEILEIRFAVPRARENSGIYHDKVGVFIDENGDSVAIHGSLNDSIRGSLNGEAFSVFKSWEEGQKPYLEQHRSRLELLWNDSNSQFLVCKIPDAVRDQIVHLRTTTERPYLLPKLTNILVNTSGPYCPIQLHGYQETALLCWENSGFKGIFEMATGTGKTYTALAAAVNRYQQNGRLTLIVLVPYLHLLEQWAQNCRDFGFNPVLCSSEHGKWQIEVKTRIQDYKIGAISNLCLLAVHKTASSSRFHNAIVRLDPAQTMIIGDEVHGLGSPELRKAMTDRADLRLGLSATPRRWYDESGTEAIFSYFGKTCFEFSLEEAIGKYLTPYRYYPQLVSLTDDEVSYYEQLTSLINALTKNSKKDPRYDEAILKLLIKRTAIISSAQGKLPAAFSLLNSIIESNKLNQIETRDLLVYCAPGNHLEILQAVASLGIRCHEFVHRVSLSNREKILDQFAKGDIQALVAIKCLDEGVDVPSTRTAIIMASSTNPREFIQRRGRILRLAKGKSEATIYDYIVVPPEDRWSLKKDTDISILRREMPRFVEFASSALNEFQARSCVREILDYYEMLNLLDEKPWDIYHNLKQWDWDIDEQT